MAAAGDDPGRAACSMLRGQGPRRASPPRSSTRRPRSSSARRAPTPAFKGYRGFPGSICASPNSMVVHGIPGPYELQARRHPLDRRRRDQGRLGRRRGAHRSRSAPVDARSPRKLLDVTAGVALRRRRAVPAGNHLGDVSHAVQRARRGARASRSSARSSATGSAATCTRTRRSPTSASPGKGPLLEEGMVLAIEPMVNAGAPRGADGRRRLGDLLPGRLAGRPLRVHGRGHRRRARGSSRRGTTRTPGVADGPGRPERRRRSDHGGPRPCYRRPSARAADGLRARRRVRGVRVSVAAAEAAARAAVAGHPAERDHEGTTVGQADVREVQDHPPPRRGARDLPEPAPQAAAGLERQMARIAGINIPLNKRVEVGLTYIYGIGRSTSNKLLARGRRSSPDTLRPRPHRGRGRQAARRDRQRPHASRATCAASAPRTSSA